MGRRGGSSCAWLRSALHRSGCSSRSRSFPVLFGWRFLLVHIVLVWAVGSLFLAFDGYYGMVVSWILAGLFAPGRWLGGDW
jgi:hypothetical protein